MAVTSGVFVTVALAFIASQPVKAQQRPVAQLRRANGAIHAKFGVVSSVRELSDGRVLIEDVPAGISAVGDFTAGTLTPMPDVHPGGAIRLGGDTTLLRSTGRGPWVFLVGTAPVGMLAADNPVVIATAVLRGADSRGHVLTVKSLAGRTDSMAAILILRSTAAEDTVTLLHESTRPSDGSPAPFTMEDQAWLTLDGWIVVVRSASNRVDWRAPDGRWIHGPRVPVTAAPINSREKAAYLGRPGAPDSVADWPAVIPVWSRAYPVVTWDGLVAVQRNQTADHPEHRYDIVNRRGVIERTIEMPADQHIIGFGKKSVYVVVGEPNDNEWVARHPWP